MNNRLKNTIELENFKASNLNDLWPSLALIPLGLSTETRHPIHPKKPSDPARKPSDPTPVTVGGGSPPPEPVIGGSVGGFSLPKSEKPEPTGENP